MAKLTARQEAFVREYLVDGNASAAMRRLGCPPKSAKQAGVQGEGNATALRLVFDESWSGYAKRIIWRDARGLCPTAVVLGIPQMTGEDTPLDYTVWIPPEPLAVAGWCSFTVEGYTVQPDGTAAVALTVSDHLEVTGGLYGSPAEPTASQALQLQLEIDALSGDIASAEGYARQALEAKQAADTCVDDASSYARMSRSWAEGGTGLRADEAGNNAKYWAEAAQNAAAECVTKAWVTAQIEAAILESWEASY